MNETNSSDSDQNLFEFNEGLRRVCDSVFVFLSGSETRGFLSFVESSSFYLTTRKRSCFGAKKTLFLDPKDAIFKSINFGHFLLNFRTSSYSPFFYKTFRTFSWNRLEDLRPHQLHFFVLCAILICFEALTSALNTLQFESKRERWKPV